MESNKSNHMETSVAITSFIRSNRYFTYVLISVLFLMMAFIGFVYAKNNYSAQAKDLSEASKLMAESLKINTETLAPIPDIVQGFTSLVDNRVASEFLKKEGEFDTKIDTRLTKVNMELEKTKGEIQVSASEIKRVMTEVEGIKTAADVTLTELNKKAEELSLLFPNVEKYKNIVDPEFLMRKLHSFDSWDEGLSIIVRFEDLVEESVEDPAKLPSKYIELAGDWCRQQNQSHLALEFYKASTERDPARMSAKVEYYSLQAEVLPQTRTESIEVLNKLALSGKLKLGNIKRIFNVLMEVNEFSALASLASSLIDMEPYKSNKAALVTLYRNNAVALKEEAEYITEEAWASIIKAVEANSDNDENVTKIYASWLLEKRNFDEAIIQSRLLLKSDPNSASYYLILNEALVGIGSYDKALKVLDYALSIVTERNDQIRLLIAKRDLPNDRLDVILDEI